MHTNRLALGTVQFGVNYGVSNNLGQVSSLEGREIISVARKAEINCIDTAIAYGNSEDLLGAIDIRDFNVVTKLPALPTNVDDTSNWVEGQVRSSIARLRVDSLYGLLLHQPRDLLGDRSMELIKALERLKGIGLVAKIGVSVYDPLELNQTLRTFKLDLVQLPYNVVDRRFASSGWISELKDAGTEVHARSTFLQGLLLISAKDLPHRFDKWRKIWKRWDALSIANDLSPVKLCLDFVFSNQNIDKIIVGVASREQLSEIVQISKSGSSNLNSVFMSSTDKNLIFPNNWS